jgi:hypothetical protein
MTGDRHITVTLPERHAWALLDPVREGTDEFNAAQQVIAGALSELDPPADDDND